MTIGISTIPIKCVQHEHILKSTKLGQNVRLNISKKLVIIQIAGLIISFYLRSEHNIMEFCKKGTGTNMSMKNFMEGQPLPQNIVIIDPKSEYEELRKQLAEQQPCNEIINPFDIHA